CLDPDPAGRPAGGRAVADAVVAYQAGIQERLRQTELAAAREAVARKQRRAVRGLGALAAVLVVAGLAAVLAVQARANADLTKKNDELAQAADRERRRFDLALEAIGLFHGEVSEDLLLKEKQFAPLRAKLLGGAAAFYRKLEAEIGGRDDPASRAALARSYLQLGEVNLSMGKTQDALAAAGRAVASRRELAAAPDAGPDAHMALAFALARLGHAQMLANHPDTEATLREALAVVGRAEADRGETFDGQFLAASIIVMWARVVQDRGRAAESIPELERALATGERLREARPEHTEVLSFLGDAHIQLGMAVTDAVRERRELRKALEYHRACLAAEPDRLYYRRQVAHSYMALGGSNPMAELSQAEVIADAETACRLASELLAEYHTVSEFRRIVALAHTRVGQQAGLVGDHRKARAAYTVARDNWQVLVDGGYDPVTSGGFLARVYMGLGDLDWVAGEYAAALDNLGRAEAILADLLRQTPRDYVRAGLGQVVRRVGLVHLAAGRVPEAAAATVRAGGLIAPALPNLGNFPKTRIEMAARHATLAGLAADPDAGLDWVDAAAEADRAMALLSANADYRPHPLMLTADWGFAPLWGRADFQRLVADLQRLVPADK
ncbi:MAG: hypothetical protein K2X87_15735, partial [Gemmataceae bacterium]|nr:hypothetical protein [Gemmataceae bacterium]